MANFVSVLQQKCQENRSDLPTYVDVGTDVPNSLQRYECKLYQWKTEGTGTSKKIAKQNSAKHMLEIVLKEGQFMASKKNTSLTSPTNTSSEHVASKVNVFASKNGKEIPLWTDKGKVDGLFVVECRFDGYTAVGKGNNMKTARKEALEDIANHFNIHAAYESYKTNKKRAQDRKNSIQSLMEVCQARKLGNPSFQETEKRDLGKGLNFVVSCTVNNLVTTSNPNFSKKNAKIEASALMLDKLNQTTHFDTPDRSPFKSNYDLVLFPEGNPSSDIKASVATYDSDHVQSSPAEYNSDPGSDGGADLCSDDEEELPASPYSDQPPEDYDEILPEAELSSDSNEPLAKRSKN